MQLVALAPDKFMHWRCLANTWGEEWINTELTFEIEPQGEKTMLRFSHRRWMKNSDFLRSCSLKWGTFLMSLMEFLEKGKGAPSPDDIET
jgi:Activator of Hsp90 ATPase homolog 1-like protein